MVTLSSGYKGIGDKKNVGVKVTVAVCVGVRVAGAGANVSLGEGKAVEEEEISTGEAFCVAWMIAFKVSAIDVPCAF
jgi:hypothetical protein